MNNADLLRKLGWSDELISASESIASKMTSSSVADFQFQNLSAPRLYQSNNSIFIKNPDSDVGVNLFMGQSGGSDI